MRSKDGEGSARLRQAEPSPQRRRFRRKQALPMITPSVIAYGDATFPKGTALAMAGNFAAAPKGSPLGELAR